MTASFEKVEMMDGHVALYCGDCREVMAAVGPVGSVITDPVWPNVPPHSVQGWDDPFGLWETALAAMPERLRTIVVMRCDSDPRFLAPVPGKFLRSINLPYVMPGYLGRVLGGDETAYWFGDPIARAKGRMVIPGRGPLVQPGGRPPNGHPMSRAQAHFDWLVWWASDADETVLDPFMGSGTTGVAAVKSGRRFVGIEIERRYFDLACDRISAAAAQPDLFRSQSARSLVAPPLLFGGAG